MYKLKCGCIWIIGCSDFIAVHKNNQLFPTLLTKPIVLSAKKQLRPRLPNHRHGRNLNKACFLRSESRRFEVKTRLLLKSEKQIHVMDCRTRRAFQKVVDNRGDQQLAIDLIKMYDTFVGIYYVF